MQKSKSVPAGPAESPATKPLPVDASSPEDASKFADRSDESSTPVRVIKKYPTRRLYDTETSAYITLAEGQRLVMDSIHFMVRDAKTGEDLTGSILLQIILEEEAGGAPMFTEAVLANIIRF